MTTKQKDPTENLVTSLCKAGNFLRLACVVLAASGAGIGGSVIGDKAFPPEIEERLTSLEKNTYSSCAAVEDRLVTLEETNRANTTKIENLAVRMDNNDNTAIEIKAQLTTINADIKKMLFILGGFNR